MTLPGLPGHTDFLIPDLAEGEIPCVIYAAKSTQDVNRSIPEQVDDGRDMAAENGWRVCQRRKEGRLIDHYSDEGFSAYSGNRGPELALAEAHAAAVAAATGRVCMLIAQNSDRFARGAGDKPGAAQSLVEIWHRTRRADVHMRTTEPEDDEMLETSEGAAILGKRAHLESARKTRSVKKGMRRRRAKRMHTGGSIFGYDRDEDRGLIPNDDAATVRRIFEMVAGGKSQAETCRILNAEGSRPLRGKQWQQGAVSNMLRTRTYLGEIRAENADGEMEWIDALHEGVVSPELFGAATRQREQAAAVRGRRGGPRPKAGHLLPGRLLYHSACGSSMTPISHDPSKDGTVTGRYICSGRKAGTCEGFTGDMAEVDETITGYLADVGIDLDASLALIRDAAGTKQASTAAALDTARDELAQVDERMQRIRGDYMEGKLSAEDWASFRAELKSDHEALSANVAQLEARMAEAQQEPETALPQIADALALIRAAAAGGDADAVRGVLESLFEGFLIGKQYELAQDPGEASQEARERLSARFRAMELSAGRTLAQAEADYWAEQATLPDYGEPAEDPTDSGLPMSGRVLILPVPRESALQSIADGEPLIVANDGRPVFRRLPLATTNVNGFCITSSAPRSKLRRRCSSPLRPLSTSSGSSGSTRVASPSLARTSRSSSRPSRSGSVRSTIARSG